MIALWTPQHVGRLLANRYTLVTCPVDEIVGTASLYQNSIRMVAVRSDWHRCGVGTALVRRLIERAAETQSVLTVQSTCFAERFYQKLGFVKQQDQCSNERRYIIMELAFCPDPQVASRPSLGSCRKGAAPLVFRR